VQHDTITASHQDFLLHQFYRNQVKLEIQNLSIEEILPEALINQYKEKN
jgi:hypothetical protein